MEDQINNEEVIVEYIKKIAGYLGIGFQGLNSTDLNSVREYLIEQMHGNRWAENKIEHLAESMANGKNPKKELGKLIKRVPAITIKKPNTNVSSTPFAQKTIQAQNKIPTTRTPNHPNWNIFSIKRGVGRHGKNQK